MKLHYFVREYSEGAEFPEVHIFGTEEEARTTMIAEAVEAWKNNQIAWLTTELDGPDMTRCIVNGWGWPVREATAINLQWHGGRVDCWRLMSQEVSL